jgi:DNA-binding XRE family transcriptional regulator
MNEKKDRGAFGRMLRFWRITFGMSQEALAWAVGVSTRHIGFLENGRANPSRTMVLNLAKVFDLNIRGLNNMLLAAGFMPETQTLDLQSEELHWLRELLPVLLRNTDPSPAIITDRNSNILMMNKAFLRLLLDNDIDASPQVPLNSSYLYFSLQGLRPYVCQWEELACVILMNQQQEVLLSDDPEGQDLLDELLNFPHIPENWQRRAVEIIAEKTTHMYSYKLPFQFKGKPMREYVWFSQSMGGAHYVSEPRLRLNTLCPFEGKPDVSLEELANDTRLKHPLIYY